LVVEVVVPRGRQSENVPRQQLKAATRERWREWSRLLDEGVYGSRADLAMGVGVSRAAVTQGLRKLANVQ
jgi:hypothetical protein